MKKRLGIIAGILGIVLAVIGIVLKKENIAVSVIGGADGPTSIFIAGKLNGDNFIFICSNKCKLLCKYFYANEA